MTQPRRDDAGTTLRADAEDVVEPSPERDEAVAADRQRPQDEDVSSGTATPEPPD